jgi:Co/Zn/Cd efflux system component
VPQMAAEGSLYRDLLGDGTDPVAVFLLAPGQQNGVFAAFARSLAVVVAALLARTAVGRYVDPALAILIGVVVLRSAISIVWESLHTLIEAAPAGVKVEDLAET